MSEHAPENKAPLFVVRRSHEKTESDAATPATLAEHPAIAIGWISLNELAKLLGRSNPRAARDWCKRHNVPYRRDGKHNFAEIEAVKRAIESLPAHGDGDEQAKLRAAATAASAIMAGRAR